MYKIGELSKLCKIPTATLRYYDGEGLLIPDEIDPFTGYRYYDARRVGDCCRIAALKSLGFTLEEIKAQLSAANDAELDALLSAKERELLAEMEGIRTTLGLISDVRGKLGNGETNMSALTLLIRAEDRVVYVAKRGIYRDRAELLDAMNALYEAIPRNLRGRRMIINYEIGYKTEALDCAAAVELLSHTDGFVVPEGCFLSDFGGCGADGTRQEYATLVSTVDKINDTYAAMTEALDLRDASAVGPCIELYYDDITVALRVPIAYAAPYEAPPMPEAPFCDDPTVHGTWKLCDVVPSVTQFTPGMQKTDSSGYTINEMCFLSAGEGYWVICGWSGNGTAGHGYVDFLHRFRNEMYTVRAPYTVEKINGQTYLFLQKSAILFGREKTTVSPPEVWVYALAEQKELTAADIRIRDNIDMPFLPDARVIGSWRVHDFYRSRPDAIDPVGGTWQDTLFVCGLTFHEDGTVLRRHAHSSVSLRFTNGMILDSRNETASAYEIIEQDGVSYLLMEWKSGDYCFGRRCDLPYYVFVRE